MRKFSYSSPEELPIEVAMHDPLSESNLFFGKQKDSDELTDRMDEQKKAIEKKSCLRAEAALTIDLRASELEQDQVGTRAQRRFAARVAAARELGGSEDDVRSFFGGPHEPYSEKPAHDEDLAEGLEPEEGESEEHEEKETPEEENFEELDAALKEWKEVEAKIADLRKKMKPLEKEKEKAEGKALPLLKKIESRSRELGDLLFEAHETEARKPYGPMWAKALATVNEDALKILKDIEKQLMKDKGNPEHIKARPASSPDKEEKESPKKESRLVTVAAEVANFNKKFIERRLEDLLDVLETGLDEMHAAQKSEQKAAKLQAKRGSTTPTDLDMDWVLMVPRVASGFAVNDRIQDKNGNQGTVQEITPEGKVKVNFENGPVQESTFAQENIDGQLTRSAAVNEEDLFED